MRQPFPAAEHQRPLASSRSYCLITEVHVCEQPSHICYVKIEWPGIKPRPIDGKSDSLMKMMMMILTTDSPDRHATLRTVKDRNAESLFFMGLPLRLRD